MRRLTWFATLALLLVPAAVEAQPRIMAGGGLSTGIGDFGDAVETGWHGLVGIQLGVPAFPIAARAEGAYHSFGAVTDGYDSSILAGALSAVFTLPGVGLAPYLLGGLGMYRTKFDAPGAESVTDPGFHAAFGVNIGALGLGGFGEVRINQVQTEGDSSRFLTATVGIRL